MPKDTFKLSLAAENSPATTQLPLSRGAKEAHGVVKEIEDHFIVCEMATTAGVVDVKLQRDIFVSEFFYGMPVTLTIDDVNGYKVPKVARRETVAGNSNFLQSIIDSL